MEENKYQFKGTPGPLIVKQDGLKYEVHEDNGKFSYIIATFWGGIPGGQSSANAHAAAALPDLFEALTDLNNAIDEMWNSRSASSVPEHYKKLLTAKQQKSLAAIHKALNITTNE